jgi:primary-amine oxidase
MPSPTRRHPLDPLDEDEITAAAAVVKVRGGLDETAWFETITLDEPSKAELARHRGGESPPRRAYVCCYEPSTNRTFNGIVDLAARKLERWAHVPGAQARIVTDEFVEGGRIAKEDEAFRAALAGRGITDVSKVLVEPWAAGDFGIASEKGERIAYGHCWLMNEAGDNPYGRPIANLHPVIDLRRRKVIRIDDYGAVPLPPGNQSIARTEGLRADLRPLAIRQEEGPSFTVEGFHVSWQKWRIRVGFNLREGLVLHEIGYEDGGRMRPIMHRASLAEMVVPYGDPRGANFRRNAFDTGEYGIGQFLDSLVLGCDCLGTIHYFDAVSHDWHGNPRPNRNAICMHEEDFGTLWKFSNFALGQSRVVRSRRLVVSSIATIGNYVYGFFWYFYQDGTIGVEVKATGIPFPSAVTPGAPAAYGRLVAPGIESHVHQHSFSFRFDMAIDGTKNAVREVNFAARPMGEGNPHGNAVEIAETALTSELAAQRTMDLAKARYWRVVSSERRNGLGEATGYKLVPGTNAFPLLDPRSPVGRRAAFMFKHFWATPYAPDELYPAGLFPNQSAGGEGLPAWTRADRNLEGENVVVWYTLNYHHLPRPEDWPVQPVVYAGFHWMPDGFFDENPAIDVPPSSPGHCH